MLLGEAEKIIQEGMYVCIYLNFAVLPQILPFICRIMNPPVTFSTTHVFLYSCITKIWYHANVTRVMK